MEQFAAVYDMLVILLVPWLVSTFIFPALQKALIFIGTLPSIAKQLIIAVVNVGVVVLGGFIGTVLPGIEGFDAMSLQTALGGLAGYVSTLIFKNGQQPKPVTP